MTDAPFIWPPVADLYARLTPEQQADIVEHVRGLSDGPDTIPAPPNGWTCFHCGARFITRQGARLHFGETPDDLAACIAELLEDGDAR